MTPRPLALVAPLIVIPLLVIGYTAGTRQALVDAPLPPDPRPHERLVVVVIDSLRAQNVTDGEMPHLAAFARGAEVKRLEIETCAANYSYPCLQTMFEGRESPYGAALHNFLGARGGQGLFGAASLGGYRVSLVSNFMLQSLYGDSVADWVSLDEGRPMRLERDLRGIEVARQQAAASNDLLVVHLCGTDKMSHFNPPGSAEYLRHFRTVDAAFAGFLEDVRRPGDNLVVLGDHGHDAQGHHVRLSLALFSGRRFDELFQSFEIPPQIRQRDLLFLFSYPMGLALPRQYEGSFFALRPDAATDARGYMALQRARLEQEGLPNAALAARLLPTWQPPGIADAPTLATFAPLFALFAVWLAIPRPRPILGLAALGLLVLATWIAGPHAGGAMAATATLAIGLVVPASTWSSVPPRALSRTVLSVGSALGVGAAIALYPHAWLTYFHNRPWPGLPVLIGFIFGAGSALALVRGGSLSLLPFGVQLICFLALPSGFRVSQFAQNTFRWYVIAVAIVAGLQILQGWKSDARVNWKGLRPTLLLCAVSLLIFMRQRGRADMWRLELVQDINRAGPLLGVLALLAVVTWLVAQLPTVRARAVYAATVSGSAIYCMGFADVARGRFAASMILVALHAAWRRWYRPHGRSELAVEERTLVTATFAVTILMLVARGFIPNHIDFAFTDRLTEEIGQEQVVFVVVGILTLLKYGLPVVCLLAYECLVEDAEAGRTTLRWVLLWLNVKILALAVQTSVSMLDEQEKLYELAIGDLVFIFSLAWIACFTYFAVSAGDATRTPSAAKIAAVST